MSDRFSEIILLCEDDAHERLVRAYLKECGLPTEPPTFLPRNASRLVRGGNVNWVLREFPGQLEACRKRHTAHAKTLLIVVVDADDLTVTERRGQVHQTCEVVAEDPVVVLIPKRHVETWIRAATNQDVNETDDYKKPTLKKAEFREAANRIYGWVRENPKPGPTCVESLRVSLPEWRKIK